MTDVTQNGIIKTFFIILAVKNKLPVLNIGNFRHFNSAADFYAERILTHIQHHDFTRQAHKHDFFLVVLFTRGHGTHSIDFTSYEIKAGTVFFLNPGQTHHWTLSKDIDGLIFFHTLEYFDKGFTSIRLRDYPFFASVYNPPLLRIKKTDLPEIKLLFEKIENEHRNANTLKEQKILSLLNLLYIDLTRIYVPTIKLESETYLSQLRIFEDLIEKHFKEIKFPSGYARLMHMTERHLNRISKTCLNKTSSDLIFDRILLEAKRLLMQGDHSISEIAGQLGYFDHSYFSRLFKKRTGMSPIKFKMNYK